MKANDGQCLNLVSFSARNLELTHCSGSHGHCRYLPNNVGTHLQLTILREMGENEIA